MDYAYSRKGDHTMDEIMELAGKLGTVIAADPRGQRIAKAQAALASSSDDRQRLADLETLQGKVHALEVQGKPIEPEDKRRLVDLQAKVAGSEVIKDLLGAQADFAELMSAVLQKIEQQVMESADRK